MSDTQGSAYCKVRSQTSRTARIDRRDYIEIRICRISQPLLGSQGRQMLDREAETSGDAHCQGAIRDSESVTDRD